MKIEPHEYDRAKVRAYFASMTPDSRPMAPGVCPIMAALGLDSPQAATTLDPALVRAVDQSLRPARAWNEMTAGDVLAVLDSLNG